MDIPEETPQPHKRRVRYGGTHPRRFSEKYKELNPEKYAVVAAGVYSEAAPMRPSPEEHRGNPRSACAKLRWAVRSSKPRQSLIY